MRIHRVSWVIAVMFLLSLIILVKIAPTRMIATRDAWPWLSNNTLQFDGDNAQTLVQKQLELGPRSTGSKAGRQAGELILQTLESAGWEVSTQEFTYRATDGRNLLGKAGSGPLIILGAHYDTRFRADRDKSAPDEPVPGANDGASGVAVLLELARVLDTTRLNHTVWLAFFDAEDNGGLDGWEWIIGSRLFASKLTEKPEAVVIVDLVGDADQQIYFDRNSDPDLSAHLWAIAASLSYEQNFIPQPRYAMLDDHTPFAELGIPAVDIIDFDYPYWHTTQDTLDKISPESLERVGRVLQVWLEGHGLP